MARLVLIAIALVGSCYDPTFADCTTTCSSSALCPDDLACTGGYCRPAGATGSCEGMMMSCPPMAPLQCGNAARPEPPNCFAVCTGMASDAATARAFKINTWHLAVLDDPAKAAAARTVAGGTAVWIALVQATGQTAPAAGWRWSRDGQAGAALGTADWASGQPDDGDGTENGAEGCAAMTSAGWTDDACTATHPLLIAP